VRRARVSPAAAVPAAVPEVPAGAEAPAEVRRVPGPRTARPHRSHRGPVRTPAAPRHPLEARAVPRGAGTVVAAAPPAAALHKVGHAIDGGKVAGRLRRLA
jgi:hypothetical protein